MADTRIPDFFPDRMDLANSVVRWIADLVERAPPTVRARLESQLRGSAEDLLRASFPPLPMNFEADSAEEALTIQKCLAACSSAMKPIFSAIFLRLLDLEAMLIIVDEQRRAPS